MAIAGDGQTTVRWDSMPDASSYAVLRATVSTGPYTEIAHSLTTTHYVDTGRTNGTRYFYAVRAANTAGTSSNSVSSRTTPVSAISGGSVFWPISASNTDNADSVRFPFGARRLTHYDFHAGIDISRPVGTPVYAVMDGTVTNVRNDWTATDGTGSGNFVLINHANQKWTSYLHLSQVDVQIGDAVIGGATKIGEVGDTGANTSHLHLTYMVGLASESTNEARSKNPLEILPHAALPTSAPYVPTVDFRNDGSNVVDISLPIHRFTMRWAILRGENQTRMLDYYEIVSQGTSARNSQTQPAVSGITIDASSPLLPDPASDQNFTLSLRPDPANAFIVEQVRLVDFNGNVILDAARP